LPDFQERAATIRVQPTPKRAPSGFGDNRKSQVVKDTKFQKKAS
jgi:hypothetical protein